MLDRLPSGARVAIIRLRSLGDCVLTTPALSLLKQARPDLQIAVVVEDRFAPLFAGNPDVDQILAPNAGSLSRFRPQLALNLHGGATSVRLMLAAASGLRAGFAHFRFQPMYNVRIPRAQEILGSGSRRSPYRGTSRVRYVLPRSAPVRNPARAIVCRAVSREAASLRRPASVCVGGRQRPGRAENFLAVAKHLDEQSRNRTAVRRRAQATIYRPSAAHTCFQGAPLEEVKSLLAGAALFVGNDSGPAHIAAAFGRPVVVLFGSSDIDNWRPWRTENVVLTSAQGIHSIEVSEVVGAIETLAPLPLAQPSA